MTSNFGTKIDYQEDLCINNKRFLYDDMNKKNTDISPCRTRVINDSVASSTSDLSLCQRSKTSSESQDSRDLKGDTINEIYDQMTNSQCIKNDFLNVKIHKQPPHNLRKSNFFNFELTFHDKSWNQVLINSSSFVGFIEDSQDGNIIHNGLKYRFNLLFKDTTIASYDIQIHLVDSITYQIIKYEGSDKNPDMCRVLLTHELMCSRCCDKKSCGNKNETPSDPVIVDGSIARLYMKCNQNCLKNAGNPKDIRRFLIMASTFINSERVDLAYSQSMFVHNNSKHGRRNIISVENAISKPLFYGMPMIKFVIPSEGSVNGGYYIALIGENFFQGINVAFGNYIVWDIEVISSTVLRLLVPQTNVPGPIEISCTYNSRRFQYGQSCIFSYIENTDYIDGIVQRLSRFIPRLPNDSDISNKASVLKRAVDLLEFSFLCNGSFAQPNIQNFQLIPENKISLNNLQQVPIIPNMRKNNQQNELLSKNIIQSMSNNYASNYLDPFTVGFHDLNNNNPLYNGARTNLHSTNIP